MSELPKGWETINLGTVCDVIRGITFPASAKEEMYKPSNVCCLRTTNVQREIDWTNVYFVSREYVKRENQLVIMGDILMSMANSYELVGKVALVRDSPPFPTAFGAFLAAIRTQTGIERQYLFHLLRTEDIQIKLRQGSSQTVNIANISVKTLSTIEIPLPPLNEQRRIVAKLDRLFARSRCAREELGRVSGLVQRYKQAVLAAAFRGDLTADWREENSSTEPASRFLEKLLEKRRYLLEQPESQKSKDQVSTSSNEKKRSKYKAPIDFREEKFFELPEAWMFVSADQISSQITDGEHIQPPYQHEGVPMLSAKHVRDGYVDMSDIKFISQDDFEKAASRCAPKNGDVLIVSVGATTGRAAIVFDCQPFAIVRSVLLMKPLISSKFVYYWISSPFCQDWISKASGASAQPHFYINDNKRMPIPLSPETEVQEIVRRVEKLFKAIDLIEQEHQQASKLLDRLEQATLSKAFRGELVPQDPNDEPAAVLLDRIQSDRQGQPKGKAIKSKQKRGEKR